MSCLIGGALVALAIVGVGLVLLTLHLRRVELDAVDARALMALIGDHRKETRKILDAARAKLDKPREQ